jgi:hypothetical protein
MGKKRFKYTEFCQSCRKHMGSDEQIVYVEENSNRFFCSEKCIRDYYDPIAEFYKKAHFIMRDAHDIPESDFAKYESYAPLALNSPDEVWCDANEQGETHYFFHKNFMDEGGAFSYVIMCFCLELEPTYMILAFPTRDRKLSDEYRRGKKLDMSPLNEEVESVQPEARGALEEELLSNQSNAVEEEMLRWRSKDDISVDEFDDYAHLLDESIESPNEVWELQDAQGATLLSMITQHDDGVTYIVICRNDQKSEAQESWQVLYSFPTKDAKLVERYRRGNLREGHNPSGTTTFMQ